MAEERRYRPFVIIFTIPLWGYDTLARCNSTNAAALVLSWLCEELPQPKPYNFNVRKLLERNEAIRRRFARGEDSITLAQEYRISRKRIYQIVRGQRK